MNRAMEIALLHAYRAANRGDGWLVELAHELVRSAVEGSEEHIVTYALDPVGMPGVVRPVLAPPTRVRASAAVASTAMPSSRALTRKIVGLPDPRRLRGVVGVGGAYLRANDSRHELVFRSHHLPQLELAASLGDRAMYLPVSIGPLPSRLDRRVRSLLMEVGTVCVRDDTSAEHLSSHPGLVRMPDLAACDIGRARPRLAERSAATVAFVLRDLPGTNLGVDVARQLSNAGLAVEFGIQSTAGHTNDDLRYYRTIGVLDRAHPFGALLSYRRPAVVVAGRLHAALAAIRAGIPTIHLGYERKSWGAFTDLGLKDWVVHAWQGDANTLQELVQGLLTDPTDYWSALTSRFEHLGASWEELVGRAARILSVD